MIAGSGSVRGFFQRAGADGEKKLTEEVAGIAPCSCSGGQIPVLYENILR
jgi:hypothetical protein